MDNQQNDTTADGHASALAEANGSASSRIDICLWKTGSYVSEDHTFEGRTRVEVEHRAWVCSICQQSTEYFLVNGCVVHGCGMRTTVSNGISIDYCDRWQCVAEAQRRIEAAGKPNTELTRRRDENS